MVNKSNIRKDIKEIKQSLRIILKLLWEEEENYEWEEEKQPERPKAELQRHYIT